VSASVICRFGCYLNHNFGGGGLFFFFPAEKNEEEEFIRLPWLGQSGRAADGCACTAAALRC
jgi:hypothetical protein